jgi:DNA-binding NtrC family response regulator
LQLQLKPDISMTLAEARRKGLEEFEKGYLEKLLTHNRGRINDSAKAAGVSTRQLHKLLTKYGIKKETYKTPPA